MIEHPEKQKHTKTTRATGMEIWMICVLERSSYITPTSAEWLLTGIFSGQRLAGQRRRVDAQDVALQPLHVGGGQGAPAQVDHIPRDQLGHRQGLRLAIPETSEGDQ